MTSERRDTLADPHFLILRRHRELMEVAHVTVVKSEESQIFPRVSRFALRSSEILSVMFWLRAKWEGQSHADRSHVLGTGAGSSGFGRGATSLRRVVLIRPEGIPHVRSRSDSARMPLEPSNDASRGHTGNFEMRSRKAIADEELARFQADPGGPVERGLTREPGPTPLPATCLGPMHSATSAV
jgi:hypothetical protein